MESSYRIIKGDYTEDNTEDKFIIDTVIQNIIEEEEEIFIEEEVLEFDIDTEEKQKVLGELTEYKKRVNMQIEFERKNILENALIDAQKDAIKIREAAYKEGHGAGYAKSLEDAEEEADSIKADSVNILKEVKKYRYNYLRENEANIYELAKTMAEKIIHHEIDMNDENIVNIVKPILEEYLKEEDVTITATPRGKELLKKHKESLERLCPNTRFIFLSDNSLEKNGFLIENKESIVDLGISIQLENMVRAISDMNG